MSATSRAPGELKQLCLLVCGERLRRDDGAAILAVGMLPTDTWELAEILEVGQLSVEALLDVEVGTGFVVADAAVGVAPGEVVTLPLADLATAAGRGGPAPASSHSIAPDQVLALAAELRGAAPRGVFVGLGGVDFGFGEGLSSEVADGLPRFADAIAEAVRRLAASSA
jgi:hydrogenase maturation protease